MKKILTSFLVLVALNSFSQLAWHPLTNAPKSYRLDDFYFVNPQFGWAISPYYSYRNPKKYGQIYKTTDGGLNWEMQVDSSLTFFRAIGFADSLTGWVGNLADSLITPDTIPLYTTTDGGVTWNPVTNIPDPKPKGICGITIVSDSVIYAMGRYYGPPVIIKSTDKGATWTSQDMSAYASGLVDAHFFEKDTGFVTGCYDVTATGQQKALILSTFDGGATWQVRHQSTRINEEVWKIVFPSRNIGYATIEYQGNSNSISTYFLKTTDGGLTWNEMPFLSSGTYYDLQGIGFINDTLGWIGGDCQRPTYKTIDGGLTWATDLTLGLAASPYVCMSSQGISMNRFRAFGDTLMYGSGYTVCKLSPATTSIGEISTNREVKIYPNPAGNEVFVDAGSNDKLVVDLFDVVGKHIMNKEIANGSRISVEHLTDGVYTITIKTNGRIINDKIVIKH